MANSTQETPIQNHFEQQKFAHEMLRKEIEYRREKAWNIFSWVSTILLGVIGGVVAIASKKSEWDFRWYHAALLTFSVLALSIYSCFWIQQNLDIEKDMSKKIKLFEVKLEIRGQNEEYTKRPRFGYVITVILLTIAALISIWLVPLCEL
jgi:hypothetical protein